MFSSGLGSVANTVRAVTIVQLAPVASVVVQVLETTAVFAASSRLPDSESTIVPLIRFGESAELVLVTTIVQVTTPPTSTGSGAQFFVTLTPGWNRFVLSVAVAVSELVPAV